MRNSLFSVALAFTLSTIPYDASRASEAKPKTSPGCSEFSLSEIWLVQSGGIWRRDAKVGNFRAIVFRSAGDHPVDRIVIEVVSIGEDSRVRERCIELSSPGLAGYVRGVSFKPVDDRNVAVEMDVEMKAMNGIVQKNIFVVSESGRVAEIVPLKWVDLIGVTEGW